MPASASVEKVTLKLWMSSNSTKLTLTLVKSRAQTRKLASPKTNETAVTGEECGDNRACWKYYRTKHLGLFIHYCPVAGFGKGNDQKDTIISHIRKDHPEETELIELCSQQSFLKSCNKIFRSVKGKNFH